MTTAISPKIVATIEARMTSSRLPGKVMRPIMGMPMLELQISRVKRARRLDQVVVATTTNSTDDIIEGLTQRLGVGCFRGSEDDVLDRVLRAALSVNADVIVELSGDCPLMDPMVIDELVSLYLANRFDYVSNILERTFPRGLDVQVFSTALLGRVAQLTQDPVDREHVSLYIYQHPELFTLHNVVSGLSRERWDLRLTVDLPEDFSLIEAIYQELYPMNPAFSLRDILSLLDRRPDLIGMNRHIQQKRVR